MQNDEPELTVLHRSVNRPNLLMGCDRNMFLFLATVVSSLIFSLGTRVTVITGIVVWVLGLAGLRAMAKADPFMRDVFRRQAGQRKFYPARSCYQRVGRTTSKTWL